MNQTIRYTREASPLGCLLVAATGRGLCAVYVGDDAETLTHALRDSFPQAHLIETNDQVQYLTRPIQAYLSGEATEFDLPLDVAGTDFQRRVWAELQRIPYGETRTYVDIATALGNPHAAQAVGAACAANEVAIVIPCHRVVRSGGGLAGFRWGLEHKRALQALEAHTLNTATQQTLF